MVLAKGICRIPLRVNLGKPHCVRAANPDLLLSRAT